MTEHWGEAIAPPVDAGKKRNKTESDFHTKKRKRKKKRKRV